MDDAETAELRTVDTNGITLGYRVDFAAVNAIRAQINDPDPAWWDGIAAVEVPTLIIGGAGSTIPQHLLAEAVRLMPDAGLVTLDAGHHVHRDRPAEFIAAVEAFLTARRVPRPA